MQANYDIRKIDYLKVHKTVALTLFTQDGERRHVPQMLILFFQVKW